MTRTSQGLVRRVSMVVLLIVGYNRSSSSGLGATIRNAGSVCQRRAAGMTMDTKNTSAIDAAEPDADRSAVERALRADARRNRELILRAADDALAVHGIDASVDEIAARAGVGGGRT